MTFYRKVFLSIFFSTLLFGLFLLGFVTTSMQRENNRLFVERYQGLGKMAANSLLQMEASVADIGINAAKHLSYIVKKGTIPSDQELKSMGDDMKISLYAVTNKDGKFIRDTLTPVETQKNKIFDFCADYRKLISGDSDLEVTPILPSSPYKGPFKFIMIPSHDRKYILEAGMNLKDVSKILSQTLSTDNNILSLGLFSPNGFNFGTIYANGKFEDGQNAATALVPDSIEFRKDTLEIVQRVPISVKNCCECKTKNVSATGEYFYLLKLEVATASLHALQNELWKAATFLFLFLSLLTVFVSHWLAKLLVSRLQIVNAAVQEMNKVGSLSQPLRVEGGDEISSLASNFNKMADSLLKFRRELIETEKSKALGELARQVAHDIRSPLSALNTVIGGLDSLSEDRRVLIQGAAQRINDIANSLLHREKARTAKASTGLISILDPLISEKRAQYRARPQIEIIPEISSGFGLFSAVDAAEVSRSLSNLINNSVEAIRESGRVVVRIYQKENFAVLEVQDNGIGIPPENLARVTELGFTHGKAQGNGLGLYSTKQMVEAAGGKLEIRSGGGTTVSVYLPLVQPPPWFPQKIRLPKASVVSVDDDSSIHMLWAGRLKGFLSEKRISHIALYSPGALDEWLALHGKGNNLFLVDYEMPGEDGISLIRRHGLESCSILVTSRTEELVFTQKVEGITVLSKKEAPFIPIEA